MRRLSLLFDLCLVSLDVSKTWKLGSLEVTNQPTNASQVSFLCFTHTRNRMQEHNVVGFLGGCVQAKPPVSSLSYFLLTVFPVRLHIYHIDRMVSIFSSNPLHDNNFAYFPKHQLSAIDFLPLRSHATLFPPVSPISSWCF